VDYFIAKAELTKNPPRVRARITPHVWVLRRLSGKTRGLRILLVWKGRATPPDGMDRRPNMGSYSYANPTPLFQRGDLGGYLIESYGEY